MNSIYWILAIVMFGVIIIVHELGHFWAARLTGTGVVEFAVGFGPKIWSWTSKKTGVLYSVRVLPLGGYCRFVSEDDPGAEDREDAYFRQAIWKRALISIGGPLLNVLTAVLLVFLICAVVGLPIGREPVIDNVWPGLPAHEAGFLPGDRIVSVNGMDIETTQDVSDAIALGKDEAILFILSRSGGEVMLSVTPVWVETEGRAMIGIEYRPVSVRLGLLDSIKSAFRVTGNMATEIFRLLRDLIFKGEGVEDLSGPIGTVVVIKEETQKGGLYNYLQLAAVISVNLGLFNMLPVPGLDGSKLIFLAIEKIRGERMDPHKEGTVLLVGLAIMVGVMVLAMYQDIVRLLR